MTSVILLRAGIAVVLLRQNCVIIAVSDNGSGQKIIPLSDPSGSFT